MLRTPLTIGEEELRRRIESTLRFAGCASDHINAVQVRCYADGDVQVEAVEMLYDGFALRAMRPYAYLTGLAGETLLKDSSAKEAMVALNRAMGEAVDQGVAIWVDSDGEVVAIDGGAVVAVFDDEVRFSSAGEGVEFEYAYSVVKDERRRITRSAIKVEDLERATELLLLDYRGITAVSLCNERLYFDIYAEKMARQLSDSEL